jgi:hypothetical protein
MQMQHDQHLHTDVLVKKGITETPEISTLFVGLFGSINQQLIIINDKGVSP